MRITSNKLIILTVVFLMLVANITFFKEVLIVYPLQFSNLGFLISLFILSTCLHIILLALFCYKYTIKVILILIVIISALAAYFMDSYRIIIDTSMLANIFQTNINEAIDLFSISQVLYLLFLGILPAIFISKVKIIYTGFFRSVIQRLTLIISAIIIGFFVIFAFSDYYASFFREHKIIRLYSNPSYYLYSVFKYVNGFIDANELEFKKIALDAKTTNSKKRKLIIFVVGETVRAKNMSLNGYHKKTNPKLEQLAIINFTKVSSCGTTTAISVPCMFSFYNRSNFSTANANASENVLDILARVGYKVLWLDNNSSSKGVADRIQYKDYKNPKLNPVCDIECRDEGMLSNLTKYIESDKDTFIVLHQMGNHGPAYYKRYPVNFEVFSPVCKTNQLEKCTKNEITNAYDNAILYSDYFLAKTINWLMVQDNNFDKAMVYVSDHGESLGENSLYLHGLPYILAPDLQKQVPMLMWFSDNFTGVNIDKLKSKVNNKYSHDNIFHTILGLTGITTNIYDKDMDIINH